MTLIISVRSNEGIVIAGDTLASTSEAKAVSGNLNVTCPSCTGQFTLPGSAMGTIRMPLNRFPSARKVFPLFDTFGVGVFGASLIQGKTPYFIIRQLEEAYTEPTPSLADTVDVLAQEFVGRIASDPSVSTDGWGFGFQLVGYIAEDPAVRVVRFSAPDSAKPIKSYASGPGGFISNGSGKPFVDKLMKEVARQSVVSLGDAVDLARFAVRTTIDHQRFGSEVPTVGGRVDILQITPYDGCVRIDPEMGQHNQRGEKSL